MSVLVHLNTALSEGVTADLMAAIVMLAKSGEIGYFSDNQYIVVETYKIFLLHR